MWFEQLQQDVRYALRSFANSPLFALTAVGSLAIGIGADTTIFSIANALLLRQPAGITEPNRLVDIQSTEEDEAFGINQISFRNFVDIRERATTVTDLFGFEPFAEPMSLAGTDTAERVFGHRVTTNYFAALGVGVAAGRLFDTHASDPQGAEQTVVLSHRFWMRRYHQDQGVIGRTIALNNSLYTVVGVAAPEFEGTSLVVTDVWVPLTTITSPTSYLERRGLGWALVRGRLKPGVSLSQAKAELHTIGLGLAQEYPDDNRGKGLRLAAASLIPGNLALPLAGIVALVMGFVSLVLVVACANLAGVLLARATTRRREIAVRVAIGAGRTRLIRQLLTETLVLFACASVGGLLLARAGSAVTVSLLPDLPFPLEVSLALDVRTIAFTIGLSLVAAVLCGLTPALQASRTDVISTLKDQAIGVAGSSRLRNAFVVSQVAVGLVMLTGAGVFTRALQKATALNPGFNPDSVELASIDLSLAGYSPTAGQHLLDNVLSRTREIPGVAEATIAANMPTGGSARYGELSHPDNQRLRGRPLPADWNVVTPGYFRTMQIPIIAGRDFTDADRDGAARVLIISEEAARRFWPGQDPIGKTLMQHLAVFRIGQDNSPKPVVVIGVVRGVTTGLREAPRPQVYLPLRQQFVSRVTVAARTSSGQRIASDLRQVIASLDRNLPILSAQTLQEAMQFALLPQRISALVSSGLGLVALVLTTMGIYGVTAHAVAQRTREIGIRISWGATRGSVVGLVLRSGMTLVGIGGVLGALLSAAVHAGLTNILFGFPPLDTVAIVTSAAIFGLVGFAACYLPMRRATRVDPAVVLRYE